MKDQRYAEAMLEFIEKSPSSFHAIKNMKAALKEQAFEELDETEDWHIKPGGNYYVSRNDSSIIALRIPEGSSWAGFHVTASHSDSPSFKVKEEPEIVVENRYIKLNTEKYG